MNKKLGVVLLVLLLCGCSREDFETVQQHYNDMTHYEGTYKYEVDFGGVFEYVCHYTLDGDKASLTVLGPEEIAGITAVTNKDGSELEYEDIHIKTYLPENEGFTAVSAIHRLIDDIRNKKPAVFAQSDVVSITYEDGDYVKKAQLSKDDLCILSLEIYYKDDRVLNIVLQS